MTEEAVIARAIQRAKDSGKLTIRETERANLLLAYLERTCDKKGTATKRMLKQGGIGL